MSIRSWVRLALGVLSITLCASAAQAAHLPGRSWISPEAKQAKALLYVSEGTEIDVFNANARNPRPIGKITDGPMDEVGGLATGSDGTLYVANYGYNNVLAFAPGATSPTMVYSAEMFAPNAVAVEQAQPADKLFVSNYSSALFSPGDVVQDYVDHDLPWYFLQFPDVSTMAGVTTYGGNAYVTFLNQSYVGEVAEFPLGKPPGKKLNLELQQQIQGIAADNKGNLVISESYPKPGIYVYGNGPSKPIRIFGRIGSPGNIAFNTDYSALYVTDNVNVLVEEYAYPSGRLINFFANISGTPAGVAVGPALTKRQMTRHGRTTW